MKSSVTSSYLADGLREQSQEYQQVACIQTQERSDVVEEAIQSQATVHQQMVFGDSDSKTMSFTLVDTTAFCSCAKDSADALCVDQPVARSSRELQCYYISSRLVSHTVEAVVHLRSLGVLTAVGCGIGSVHEVVRSNLLVEPSEVEEGEM
ncbi:hypothetical protein F511_15020 [Dorcoceras hygrometricum]|uniref:Uncharacterized protein n=1 Tax=Dorcoceras hygrometricum TaxID=472368 RepID=A0A2Z7AAR7_9LAMI|nr:hypothetical protein F511_15020 [Dorcoceras hygrometricum]